MLTMVTDQLLLCLAWALSGVLLRRRPVEAVALAAAGAIYLGFDPTVRQSLVVILLAATAAIEICYVAAVRPRRTSLVAGALVVGAVAILWFGPPGRSKFPHGTALLAVALLTVIAWLIGDSIRQTHRHNEALRSQAAADAVTAERLRIARELHDMVAHSIGIIAIQAGAGSRVIDTQPGQAKDALAAIEATSRETLAGLRRMLTGLRRAGPEAGPESGPQAGPGQAPREPAPGLADIGRLTATTLDAGVVVDVHWRGSRAALPADIDLSAYRIIQEAITNVVRHAGTSQCHVSIDRQDDQLSIEVVDSGRGGAVAGTGFGIVGMRERAGLLGGQFSAGPRPGGGFRVSARLPMPCPPGARPVGAR
jgi:signal transduction histidine kinase